MLLNFSFADEVFWFLLSIVLEFLFLVSSCILINAASSVISLMKIVCNLNSIEFLFLGRSQEHKILVDYGTISSCLLFNHFRILLN